MSLDGAGLQWSGRLSWTENQAPSLLQRTQPPKLPTPHAPTWEWNLGEMGGVRTGRALLSRLSSLQPFWCSWVTLVPPFPPSPTKTNPKSKGTRRRRNEQTLGEWPLGARPCASTSHPLSHLIFLTTLRRGYCYYSHVTDEETGSEFLLSFFLLPYMQAVYQALPFFLRNVPQTNNFTFCFYHRHGVHIPSCLNQYQLINQLTDQLRSLS